jgi:hypothetical protein
LRISAFSSWISVGDSEAFVQSSAPMMTRFRFLPLLCLGFCLLMPTMANEGGRLNLNLNWQVGKTYDQEMEITQRLGIPLHGRLDATTTMRLTLKPESSKAGKALALDMSSMKILVDMPLPKADEKFDSAKPTEGNEDVAEFFGKLKECNVKAKIDSRGQTTELTGMEALTTDDSLVSRFLGKKQFAYLLQQGWFFSFPKTAVKQGDSWPFKVNLPTPMGTFLLAGTYTASGLCDHDGQSCWKIAVSGTMAGELQKPTDTQSKNEETQDVLKTIAAMGLKVTYAGIKGEVIYDPQIQHLRKSEIETDIRLGVANYPENNRPAEIPLQQKVVTTLSVRP